jgi:hypothetical protein
VHQAVFVWINTVQKNTAGIRVHTSAVNLKSAPDLRAIHWWLKLTQAKAEQIFSAAELPPFRAMSAEKSSHPWR